MTSYVIRTTKSSTEPTDRAHRLSAAYRAILEWVTPAEREDADPMADLGGEAAGLEAELSPSKDVASPNHLFHPASHGAQNK